MYEVRQNIDSSTYFFKLRPRLFEFFIFLYWFFTSLNDNIRYPSLGYLNTSSNVEWLNLAVQYTTDSLKPYCLWGIRFSNVNRGRPYISWRGEERLKVGVRVTTASRFLKLGRWGFFLCHEARVASNTF